MHLGPGDPLRDEHLITESRQGFQQPLGLAIVLRAGHRVTAR